MILNAGSQVRHLTVSNTYQPVTGTTFAARVIGTGSSFLHVTLRNNVASTNVSVGGLQVPSPVVVELDDVVTEIAPVTTVANYGLYNGGGTVTVKNSELNGQYYGVYGTAGATTRLINTLISPRVTHGTSSTTLCINTFNSGYAAITSGSFTGTGSASTICAP
jgi:hypothetical protein